MLQWWCAMEELAAPAIARRRGRTRPLHARALRARLPRLDAERAPAGASRARSGGATGSRSGTAPTGTSPSRRTRPTRVRRVRLDRARAQEEDVLDTWFSSALYPFATLGWPDETPELETYYPGSVLTTARDIIFLWVARMIFSGLELRGKEPFDDVLIHSTLLNPEGRRMSRTLGTGIDPEDALEPYGADATRYGLAQGHLDAGRALLVRLDRGGPQARDQALERRAADPRERRGRPAENSAPGARGALDPRAARRRAGRARGVASADSTSRPPRRSSTTSPSTTSATGTRSRSSRASTTATRPRSRRRSPRSSACSRSSIPSCRT